MYVREFDTASNKSSSPLTAENEYSPTTSAAVCAVPTADISEYSAVGTLWTHDDGMYPKTFQ